MNRVFTEYAIKLIATCARPMRAAGRFAGYFVLGALLAACAGIVDKPVPRTLYDFGPGLSTPAPARQGSLPPVVLSDIDAAGALDGTAVLYRLGYADANQLRPYAQARWSAPPPQLVRQRLRELLGRDRVVLNPGESAALAREGGSLPRVLRIELEEFSHLFESPAQSVGLLRMRVTLMENTAGGEKLLAQRSVVVRRPAATADAPGGVRALAAATDAAAEDIGQWLQQVRQGQ
jgi:cholesterol transport system auxiliary component